MSRTLPVTHSVLSPAGLAKMVLPRFGVNEVDSCKLHSVNVNDTYEVHASSGEIFFLRVYRHGYRSLPEVKYEMEALLHLRHHGASVAYPLTLTDGSYQLAVATPEGERYAVVFPAALGKEPKYDEDAEHKAFDYGRAVAKLHNAAEGFTSTQPRFHLDIDTLIDTPLCCIAPVLSCRSDFWAYLQDFAARLKQKINNFPAGSLEMGFCHGDLQGYHHRIDTSGRHTFFDFDFCGYGFRAYDLSVFRWCGRLSDKEIAWWEPYLKGYQTERTLNQIDIDAVPLFICARHIWHMGLHTGNAQDWGYGDLNDNYFNWRIERLKELDKEYLKG